MSGARVLVTGAGGFVGSALAEGFLTLGWRVTAVDAAFDAAAQARLGAADLVTLDLAQGAGALPRADLVIHAAALTTSPEAMGITAAEHVAANTLPLLAVLKRAAEQPPSAFVFLSSTGVFGPGDGDPDLSDTATPTATGPYSAAKRAGEQLAPAALDGLSQVHVLRLGHIYGPEEAARPTRRNVSLMATYAAAAAEGRPLAVRADDPRRDWTLAEDFAPAIARLVEAPAAGRPLHFGAPQVLRDSALAALFAARFPGLRIESAPAAPAKPPMRPSAIPALEGFAWTTPEAGVARLAARRHAA